MKYPKTKFGLTVCAIGLTIGGVWIPWLFIPAGISLIGLCGAQVKCGSKKDDIVTIVNANKDVELSEKKTIELTVIDVIQPQLKHKSVTFLLDTMSNTEGKLITINDIRKPNVKNYSPSSRRLAS